MTAREIAVELGVTYHAVRLHLLALERDGVIHVTSTRGTTRPANVYSLKPGYESTLSRAYAPFAAQLTRVLGERLSQRQLNTIMRDVGTRLADAIERPAGSLRERTAAAALLLRDWGSPNEVVSAGTTLTIRSSGCILAEAVHSRPEVCLVLESFLRHYIGADVRQRCDRGKRPCCRFDIRRAS
jgi:predicted ArsR family transcriptional regulator